ncbi:hypothetical protein Dimus_002832, partial [Dionaea muscipula]
MNDHVPTRKTNATNGLPPRAQPASFPDACGQQMRPGLRSHNVRGQLLDGTGRAWVFGQLQLQPDRWLAASSEASCLKLVVLSATSCLKLAVSGSLPQARCLKCSQLPQARCLMCGQVPQARCL